MTLISNCYLCSVNVVLIAVFVVAAAADADATVAYFVCCSIVVADASCHVWHSFDDWSAKGNHYCHHCRYDHANDFANVDPNSHNFGCPVTWRLSNNWDFGRTNFSQRNYFECSMN